MKDKLTEREEVVELINRLFFYTDNQNWDGLKSEVFTTDVNMKMVFGAEAEYELKTSEEICQMWSEGFDGIDAIHHQAGTHVITFNDEGAQAYCYSIASHYKSDATNGKTREFIGTYDLGVIKTEKGYRLNRFCYVLKYMTGNAELI